MSGKPVLFLFIIIIYLSTPFAQTKKIQANKNESTITYQLTHPLHEIESTSKNVNCWADLDPVKKEISHVFVQVDVTTFNSGNSNRDSHAMEVIDAISYPYVKFNSSSVTTTANNIKVTGKLLFHGVTRDLTFEAIPKWEGNKLTVTGKFQISLTEYKVERPSLLLVPVNDELKFSFNQVFNL
ncbi:MAG: YceI family protein [Ignavibacteriaceae bacterium]|nr:YceI family protein [Ignavibacteriaceae bacterium]